jgi:NAD(P)H-dependent FMN reductase
VPVGEHLRQKAPSRTLDRSHDRLTVTGEARGSSPPIRWGPAPLDQLKAFQFRELPAHGRMVTSDLIGKFRDAQRASHPEADEQGEQGAVEVDAGLTQERIVALRAVQEAHEVDERGSQAVQITCILHLYSALRMADIVCMIHAFKILVIIGSTRPRRICPQIAEWVADVGRGAIAGVFEVVDLKTWHLPMDDEPGVPARGSYTFDHTRAWSRKISEGDAVVFVTPQYNWGYPAPLKNALDHLYREWSGKPAMIVSYGGHGGDKCAAQLRQVLDGLKMKPVETMPGFKLARERIDANAGVIEPATEFAAHLNVLRQGYVELAAALSTQTGREA